jgi:hypothetical protein
MFIALPACYDQKENRRSRRHKQRISSSPVTPADA